MSRNRKIPYSKRVQYDEETDGDDELDAKGIPFDDLPKTIPTDVTLADSPVKLSCSSRILTCCCCEQSCWKVTESFNKEKHPHPFRFLELIATFGSLIFFFYDVVSDILLARKYYTLERWTAFGFTVSFIAVPLVVVNLTSLRWYIIDFYRERRGRGYTSCWVWFLRVLFTFPLLMGPVVRHIEYMYHGWRFRCARTKERDRQKHYTAMLHEDTDAGMLRMFEAFLESAPQLVLQLYIILIESPDEGVLMSIIRPVSMVGSWIGVSWSLVSYHKALRASHNEEEVGLSIFGTIFYYIWRACEVGPRMLVLALFASQFSYWMLVVVALHWILMVAWVTLQNPQFYKKTIDKVVFNFLIGFVMIFCFQNVQNGPSRFRQLVYYFTLYAENLAMLVLWSYFTSSKSEWYYFAALGFVPGAIILHICVQMIYYQCFHPNCDDIPVCLNCGAKYNLYQFVCHEIPVVQETSPDHASNGKIVSV